MGKKRASIEKADRPSDPLWRLSTRLRGLGETMRGASGEEITLSDAGLHGLASILLEVADDLNEIQEAIERERE